MEKITEDIQSVSLPKRCVYNIHKQYVEIDIKCSKRMALATVNPHPDGSFVQEYIHSMQIMLN